MTHTQWVLLPPPENVPSLGLHVRPWAALRLLQSHSAQSASRHGNRATGLTSPRSRYSYTNYRRGHGGEGEQATTQRVLSCAHSTRTQPVVPALVTSSPCTCCGAGARAHNSLPHPSCTRSWLLPAPRKVKVLEDFYCRECGAFISHNLSGESAQRTHRAPKGGQNRVLHSSAS